MFDFDQEDEKLSVKLLEELFQKTLTLWNNLEFDIDECRPKWPSLKGTRVYGSAQICFCSSALDTDVIDLEFDFDYNYLEAGFGGTRHHISVEIMFVDFLLHYLAYELGYDLIELQSEEHYQLYLKHKDNLEAGGWIPYDGKGMPEGLEEKLVSIFCFGSDETEFTRKSWASKGKCWGWHPTEEGDDQFNSSCIAFYKVQEEVTQEEPVGNPTEETENV